ncbi:glycosyltransferase family A protein [Flavivirga spongiicola]|uniref:Glycosyltransferase family 2 protein n=1 Tax=Flavivirga spongiicola TaxID=421621 RepID=A0ABU7XN69_9FLAO|nr:glycosyltransferase family A protein [Flavivirga sp. MEBiC05379]MDO5981664.1 glycosyltransferase family A protein [Flavivirga sp. MEBiC05379]
MRIEANPTRDKKIPIEVGYHRVIIPLYVPKEKDYYKDAFRIFKLCLESLIKTTSNNIKISVISNGCCNSVNQKLFNLYEEGLFEELIIEKEGIGKINSVLKALRTCNERLITITDADVLFLNEWEKEVVSVFEHFPKAGAVCPVPIYRKHKELTGNIWMDHLFSNKMKFSKVLNPEAMTLFAKSIGWPWLDEKYKDVILTLDSKKQKKAVVGCSHFVTTYKKEVFDKLPKGNTEFKISGDSEYRYTDLPVLKAGGYRLSTYDNYAYHMGNIYEEWMGEVFDEIKNEHNTYELDLQSLKNGKYAVIKHRFFTKLLKSSLIHLMLLKLKGLPKSKFKNFISGQN